MTDRQAMHAIENLREWAKDKYGCELIDPTGPEVGSELFIVPVDGGRPFNRVYTEEEAERSYQMQPWRFIANWQYMLGDLLTNDEMVISE
jgi:hypothetical protein